MHVVAAVRVGADARNPQEFAQFFLEPCGVGIQVLVDGGHGNSPGVGWKTVGTMPNIMGRSLFDHWVRQGIAGGAVMSDQAAAATVPLEEVAAAAARTARARRRSGSRRTT